MKKYHSRKARAASVMLTLTLALVMVFTMIPVFDAPVYGGTEDDPEAVSEQTFGSAAPDTMDLNEIYLENEDGSLTELSDEDLVIEEGDSSGADDITDISESEEISDDTIIVEADNSPDQNTGSTASDTAGDEAAVPDESSVLEQVSSDALMAGSTYNMSDFPGMFTYDAASGTAAVSGYFPVWFTTCGVDSIYGNSVTVASQTVNVSFNMNNYSPGYHTIYLHGYVGGVSNIGNSNAEVLFVQKFVPSNITTAPNYNGVFEVYSTYLYYRPYDLYSNTASYNLYMDYSADGGKTWTTSGYMRSNLIQTLATQQYTIGGLKPNTKYVTRIYYGASGTYEGQSYFFKGPVRYTGTYKTGKAKKPKVKSVTVKAVKVKFHKHYVRGHYETTAMGNLIWIRSYVEKYYTCKFKVTVRLKKKTGAKGLWINGKFIKGNKKKYTATFTPYPNYYTKNPKGRAKFKVSLCSYQSTSYGGYSPLYSKTKKAK